MKALQRFERSVKHGPDKKESCQAEKRKGLAAERWMMKLFRL